MKYALLPLNSLTLRKFLSWDELENAGSDLRRQGIAFAAFRYHADAKAWVQMEVL